MKINVYILDSWYDNGNIFNDLGHLKLLINLDITKRFLYTANIEFDINIVVLQATDSKQKDYQFPDKIKIRYNLFIKPNVIYVPHNDGSKWPYGDINYMPIVMGVHPQPENPPIWLPTETDSKYDSKKIRGILRFIISDDKKKFTTATQLIENKWSYNDIRTLLTFSFNKGFELSINEASKLLEKAEKTRKTLRNKKFVKGYRSVTKQSCEVLLAGFLEKIESNLNLVNIPIPINIYLILDILKMHIAPFKDHDRDAISNYKEITQFYNVCLFMLFPKDYLEMKIESCILPSMRDDLKGLYENERIISIPVQVDGKIRGHVKLTASQAQSKQIVLSLAYEIPQVNKALGNIEAKKIIYKKERLLGFQSVKSHNNQEKVT